MKVFYGDKQNADQGTQNLPGALHSPSAWKPRYVAESLRAMDGIEIVEPRPVDPADFCLAHDPAYVNGILSLAYENGFGSRSQSVVDSLPYTTGAMYDAALAATADKPTCALVSGFHHAGYHGWRGLGCFCTFNGLVVVAAKFSAARKTVAIIDCDQHWGNGTDDILGKMPALAKQVVHISFGKYFHGPKDSGKYLSWLERGGRVFDALATARPDVVLYQAGADAHVDDPYGGVLTTAEMFERDRRMFSIAKELRLPLAWNLAGGYQIDTNGSIAKVIGLHLNTFRACREVYP